MSQNMRNQPGEGDTSSGRQADNRERSRYEGFEGMNYEQRRPSYSPKQSTNDKNDISYTGNGRDQDKP